MPPKSGKLIKKPQKPKTTVDIDDDESVCASSVIDSEIDSEINPVDSDVNYGIQSSHVTELQAMLEFFSDAKMINPSNDPSTNIIDRRALKCYNVPEKKIPKMFKLIEACRRSRVSGMMLEEKQQDTSGIMLDFDIYQDTEKDQISDEILYVLCQKIIELLIKLLNFGNTKKETFYIGITRRPKITYNEEHECYKDGFHLLIPSIKVSRGVKRLLINKLIDGELIDQLLSDIEPADITMKNIKYQRKDFLDKNSSFVPIFFIGSATKKGSPPYILTHIYETTVNFETKSIMLVKNDSLMKSSRFNVTYEFSVNFESPMGIIKKQVYEPQDKFVLEVAALAAPTKDVQEANRNFGILSMNSIHDAQILEIKNLLDTLSPSRYTVYEQWRDVMFALANTSPSYRDLAEYFSRKWPKFTMPGFEKVWNAAVHGPARSRKAVTLGSIHHWAKIDNPERYQQLRKDTVHEVLLKMVYEGYKEGILSHADIADIIYRLLKFKYITDIPQGEKKRMWFEFILDEDDHRDGELYKWRLWRDEQPVSLTIYISQTLPALFELVFKRVKKNYEDSNGDISKYYKKVLDNFKGTMRKLGDRVFIKNVISMAENKFSKCGFADSLDKNPIIRGVANGVLKLGWNNQPPQLIQGYHTHLVSKYTDVPYIAFDPYDPITKKILITLRGMFPNNETDTFEFTMYFLASTLDGNPKESMIMLMVGQGSNGKSFLVELHKSAIGETYGVKMPLSFLTAKGSSPDNATPAVMMLRDATFAYYSESEKHEVLNAARMKEITGQETLAGRKLHQDMVNFKPKCHHLVTSNNDFDIHSHDHGTWRRVIYNPLKIRFIDVANERIDVNNPLQREADVSITDIWTADPEVRGRYLGFMVWMHYWLYHRYGGKVKKVPYPHIKFETEKYKLRQDTITAFLSQRFVKTADPEAQTSMTDEIQKYITWFSRTQGGILQAKGLTDTFLNSSIGKFIKTTKRGLFLVGHRFLDHGETLNEGEEYAMSNVYDLEMAPGNAGVIIESPDEYYTRVCAEYDKYKHLFVPDAKFDVDLSMSKFVDSPVMNNPAPPSPMPAREDNVEINGRILPNGVVLKQLEEPTINYLTGNFCVSQLSGFLPLDDDFDYCDASEDDVDEIET